jgi:signal transduction histidine kinase/ActR/RegA family two-component response regulator
LNRARTACHDLKKLKLSGLFSDKGLSQLLHTSFEKLLPSKAERRNLKALRIMKAQLEVSKAGSPPLPTNRPFPIQALLIEDSPSDVLLLREGLGTDVSGQFALTHVERLEDGLKCLVRDRFDVVFLDLGLPDSQGLETMRKLRLQDWDVPVIILTGLDDETLAANALHEGAQDYLVKGHFDGYWLTRATRYALERHRLFLDLRRSEQQLAEAQRIANLGSWEWNVHTGRIAWSAQMYRTFGLDPRQIEPSYESLLSYVHLEDRVLFQRAFDQLLTRGIPFHLEHRILTADTTDVRYVLSHGEVVAPAPPDSPCQLAGTVLDMTELKQAERALHQTEEQLRQAQQLQAIGRLAGGVAHDFNNLLTAVIGYSEMLLDQTDRNDPRRAEIEQIRNAGERATSLTRQLLAFGRKQVLYPTVLDLNAVIEEMERMLRSLIGENIDLAVQIDPKLGKVKVDTAQIQQVVLNLTINARDAMPAGGRLTIETANTDIDESRARGQLAIPPGPYVTLIVSDSGCGMDFETQGRIFEPFFTTKEVGKGTGLGLSTVYGIVKQSGGSIEVYSAPNQGSTFKIHLPRVEENTLPKAASLPDQIEAKGTETILLVEDDPMVRTLTLSILRVQGYTVLEAAEGDEAVRIAQQHRGPIHLVLSDVVLPGIGCREVVEKVAGLHPDVKVLYFSGYAGDAIIRQGLVERNINFLEKPFTIAQLATKVRGVLESPKTGSDAR